MKKSLGQYFTPKNIADFMVSMSSKPKNANVLEPSCGEGVFLESLIESGFNNISAYEIDESLDKRFEFIRNQSFISSTNEEKFDLIIGNPPYVRWKNLPINLKNELTNNYLWNEYCNSLCDYLYLFIIKSVTLLNENGELIFICPEYWLNTSHAQKMRNMLIENGYIDSIIHFNESKIFKDVSSSTIIFKYIKSKINKPSKIEVTKLMKKLDVTKELLEEIHNQSENKDIEYFFIDEFKKNEVWSLIPIQERDKLSQFERSCTLRKTNDFFDREIATIGDACYIGNGMVSGLDTAFQIESSLLNEIEKKSLIKVIKAKNLEKFYNTGYTEYIFINNETINEEDLRINYPNFYKQLEPYKKDLEKRYSYNRNIPYWHWVFLRNYKNLFSKPERKIFIPCKERISNKNYFRFSLVDENALPTQDVTAIYKKPDTMESLEYIVAFLNIPLVFDWLKYKGVVKGNIVEFSESPISRIPFRKINWNDKGEIYIHNKITNLSKEIIFNRNISNINKINELFDNLLQRENYDC